MKKITVTIALILITFFIPAQILEDTATFTLSDGFPLTLGAEDTSGRRNVTFHVNNNAGLGSTMLGNYFVDSNSKNRYSFLAKTNSSSFTLSDKDGKEFFKVNEGDLGNNKSYLQLLKPDSRVIIGSHAFYEPDYKLAIKSGSALVDGSIIANENIGIGTSIFEDGEDMYRLSVNGKIRAHGVKVYTGWADYVFKKDYVLRPLEDVEYFIEENGHLPNVPSEKEVEENGIELGEMNAKLLEKIEELTLYLIEQNKEIKTLKKQIHEITNN